MPDRTQLDRWLLSEAMDEDAAAEAQFARLFAALPKVEPGAAFVQRTVADVRRMRARHRRLLALGRAAAVMVVAAGAVTAYVASPGLATAVIEALAFAGSRSVPWLVAYTAVAMDWWWTLARIGGTVATALVTPARVVAVVGVELAGILAFLALQRIAGAERLGEVQI